jgi:hypothetical protein
MYYWCMEHRVRYPENSCCPFCAEFPASVSTQKPKQEDEVRTIHCENRDQAQALADFLWNEKQRHLKDIKAIHHDLIVLRVKWDVVSNNVVAFVKP